MVVFLSINKTVDTTTFFIHVQIIIIIYMSVYKHKCGMDFKTEQGFTKRGNHCDERQD